MTSKLSNSRHTKASPGTPLFGQTDYPVTSAVDALITLSKSIKSYPFRFLLWTEDKKGFEKYQEGRSVVEIEFNHSAIAEFLENERYHAVVIAGEDLTRLVSHLEPSTILIGFRSGPRWLSSLFITDRSSHRTSTAFGLF